MSLYDVVIAGSGPVACTYARIILEEKPNAKILMIEIGSQDSVIKGANLKNSLKYRKDIDSFVNVIKGALQPVSIPPEESFIATLGGSSWHPPLGSVHQFHGCNPAQLSHNNLRGAKITRTVGGMATHWTCCCPQPTEKEERKIGATFVNAADFGPLFVKAGELLSVNPDAFNETNSIRHKAIKKVLTRESFEPENLPLGVKVSDAGQVTWTGADTVLGDKADAFTLRTECRVTKLLPNPDKNRVIGVEVRDYATNTDENIYARAFVIACGAICTPQILWNSADKLPVDDEWTSKMRPEGLGCYLSEQSLAFCQIVLSKKIIDEIWPGYPEGSICEEYKEFEGVVEAHKTKYPSDKLPIPFDDLDPQVYLRYRDDEVRPWHVQIHRDAFQYGEVGVKADPRVVIDLRFIGRSELNKDNRVVFEKKLPTGDKVVNSDWEPNSRDIYGMPQPTFEVTKSDGDKDRDQLMMEEMCKVASQLGGYLPGAYPQFMEPGQALHITGTIRMGESPTDSVVDSNSKVHGVENLWLGGNGVIPDSTACNPTRTSVAYAIRGARALAATLV